MRFDATSVANMVGSISTLTSQQADITGELSSGVRLSRLSDDAVAAGQAVTLADAIGQDSAYLATSATAGSRMQAADTALASVVTQLTSAVSASVAALNSAVTTSRAAGVQQLVAIRDSLLTLANSSYGGRYLFSGSGSVVPFTQGSDGTVTYSGNSAVSRVPLASGATVDTALSGSTVFLADGASVFGALNDLIAGLNGGTINSGATGPLITTLKDALANVSFQREGLNLSQNRLTGDTDYITAQKTNAQAQQTTLLAADPVLLATDLSSITTRRSALLNTIALVQKGTIFDYI